VKKLHVFIIDDSALMRQLMSEILSQDESIESVETANDPLFALPKMQKRWPDVILLDLEMPRMNGLEFARKIMSEKPTPIIIVSGKTKANMRLAIEALNAGAVEVIHKPEVGLKEFLVHGTESLLAAIKAAAAANVSRLLKSHREVRGARSKPFTTINHQPRQKPARIVTIGASTGGTVAIETILLKLRAPICPVVVVQHMPAGYTGAFAERLNKLTELNVIEAQDGMHLESNSMYVAPGGLQTAILDSRDSIRLSITDTPPVNRHKPSVDVLFESSARIKTVKIMSLLLTGMGADGAKGMLSQLRAGAETIAQDAESSVVFGMPAEAIKLGAACRVKPLDLMHTEILAFSDKP